MTKINDLPIEIFKIIIKKNIIQKPNKNKRIIENHNTL